MACTLSVTNSYARKIIQLCRTVAEHDLGQHAVDIRKCVHILVTLGEQAGQGWLVPVFSRHGWKPRCEDRPYCHVGPAGVQVSAPHYDVLLDEEEELPAQLDGVFSVVMQLMGAPVIAMDGDMAERPGGAIDAADLPHSQP